MQVATLQQLIMLEASPDAVYEALMDSAKHATFTGAPADISRQVGGSFTVHNELFSGMNLELEPGTKIVQHWRSEDWPRDHWSVLTLMLSPMPKGTALLMIHRDVPTDKAKNVDEGWMNLYWKPLRKFLKKSGKPVKAKSKTAVKAKTKAKRKKKPAKKAKR